MHKIGLNYIEGRIEETVVHFPIVILPGLTLVAAQEEVAVEEGSFKKKSQETGLRPKLFSQFQWLGKCFIQKDRPSYPLRKGLILSHTIKNRQPQDLSLGCLALGV